MLKAHKNSLYKGVLERALTIVALAALYIFLQFRLNCTSAIFQAITVGPPRLQTGLVTEKSATDHCFSHGYRSRSLPGFRVFRRLCSQ